MDIENVVISKPKQIRKLRETKQVEDELNQNPSQNQSQNQELPTKNQSFLNVSKNNQIIKKESIISKFSPINTESDIRIDNCFKIIPTTLINKIQKYHAHHQNILVHKQLGFDVMIQADKTPYKVMNCICSIRPNSQIYKHLSKNFFENLKNGIDQCILFTGSEAGARTQSSIGDQNNPGMFMIVAIAVLDQKYKENHEMFDVEFSFLQYRGQKMFDLISYTELPLEPKFRQNSANGQKSINVQFCQHRVKVCTFLQFIRLFKIALFNNKERDIRTNKQPSAKHQTTKKPQQLASTFIMKIRIKKYNDQSKLIFEQQTILIDLDSNCSLRNNGQNRQQSSQLFAKQTVHNIRRSSDAGNRSLMDFILIEINNSNPLNKAIHYHMVEKNLLLEVLKKYLRQKQPLKSLNTFKNLPKKFISSFTEKQEPKQYFVGGSLFIIHSFSTNPLNYQQNRRFYESLTSALGQEWQANYKTKIEFNKLFDLSSSDNALKIVINQIKSRKYASLKDLYYAKQFYVKQSKKIISDIKANRNIILQCFNPRKNLTYNKNVLTAYQLQLIGNCIKSDNFKDFYTSKSYLALPRQVQIKTQKIKAQINDGIKNLKQTEEKYDTLKKKQHQEKKHMIVPDFLKNSSNTSEKLKQTTSNLPNFFDTKQSKTKFKILQESQYISETSESVDYQNFVALKKQIQNHFQEVWYRALLTDQRTIEQQLILEDFFVQETRSLKERLKSFIRQVQSIEEIYIRFTNSENMTDADNFTKLRKSSGQFKKSTVKEDLKNSGILPLYASKSSFNLKKENILQRTTNFPKIQQNQSFINKREKSLSTKSIKNKDKKKIEVFQIKAKVNFGSLILNPKKLS